MTDISALEAYAGQLSEAAAMAVSAAETQRQIVNGDALTDVSTESGPVPTLAKQAVLAQAKVTASLEEVASQMAGAMTYATPALGLAGTQNGGYFSVPSGVASEYLILYKNSSGAAVEVKRYPSASAITDRFVSSESAVASRIPIAVTESGQVSLWLEDGLLAAGGVAQSLRENVTKDTIARSTLSSGQMLPLMVTALGQVVLWLEDGRLNGAGLHTTVNELIQAALNDVGSVSIKHTDGAGLFSYRAKIANLLGGSGQARVLFTGDSWTEHLAETAQPLSAALYNAYGQSGQGWISLRADEGGGASTLSQLLNGARLIKSAGWTLADMTLVADSLDGYAVVATGETATISITNLKTQALKWYYKDGDGAFRYSVDGGSPVTVTCGNTGLRKSLDISGLTDTVHSIVFDLVGNPGTVTMYGGMATRTAPGVEFSKAGNGGSTASQWKVIAPYIQSYAAEFKPDVAIIILGTNDKNQSVSKTSFKSSLRDLVTAYKTGAPNCCVLLVTPTMGGSSADLGLIAQYAEAMHELSQESTQVEYLNLNAFMPPRVVSDAMGLWNDSNHLSEAGGRFVTGLLMKYLLKTN